MEDAPHQSAYRAFPWRRDATETADDRTRWQRGLTDIPMVDLQQSRTAHLQRVAWLKAQKT
ncbi:hypothetical protein [Sulfurivirga caldicuralii]|uniref:hypothetical protein n=1 Tax=Sulfurivirga caldicuralii TaxID=364032 RepID=UPI00389A9729